MLYPALSKDGVGFLSSQNQLLMLFILYMAVVLGYTLSTYKQFLRDTYPTKGNTTYRVIIDTLYFLFMFAASFILLPIIVGVIISEKKQ